MSYKLSHTSRTILSLAAVAAFSLYGIPTWAVEGKQINPESKEINYDYTKPFVVSQGGGEVKIEPSKGEPTKGEPTKDEPSKDEPSKDEGSCVDPAGTELVETGDPGVVKIKLDPDLGGENNCTCYDVDNGNNPGIPGGVAVVCNSSTGGQVFRNLSQKDGVTPGVANSFREYVCGMPAGSTPHLTNGGVVMMSYYEYNMPDPVQWGPNAAQPAWTNRFFGDQFAFTTGSATPVGGGGAGLPSGACEEEAGGAEEPPKDQPTKQDPVKTEPGKVEPTKQEPVKEVTVSKELGMKFIEVTK